MKLMYPGNFTNLSMSSSHRTGQKEKFNDKV